MLATKDTMKCIKDKECCKDIRWCLWATLTESLAMKTKEKLKNWLGFIYPISKHLLSIAVALYIDVGTIISQM